MSRQDLLDRIATLQGDGPPSMTAELAKMLLSVQPGHATEPAELQRIMANAAVCQVALLETIAANIEHISLEVGDGGRVDSVIQAVRDLRPELAEIRDKLPSKTARPNW